MGGNATNSDGSHASAVTMMCSSQLLALPWVMADPVFDTSSEEVLVSQEPEKTSWKTSTRRQGTSATTAITTAAPDRENFVTHFPKALRKIHGGFSLSQNTVSNMDLFAKSMLFSFLKYVFN